MIAPVSMSQAERVIALARRSPDRETCGLLLGRGGRVETLPACDNVAEDPRTAFEIAPAALIAAHRAARSGGPAVLGCWHSHPGGRPEPSARDAAAAEIGQLWLIVADDTARLFRREISGFVELDIDPEPAAPCLADDPPS